MLIQQARVSIEVPQKAKELIEQYSLTNPIQLLIPIFTKGQEMGEFCEGDPYKLLFCYLSIISGLVLQEIQADENYWIHEIDVLMKILIT